jgi:hypothetical protein
VLLLLLLLVLRHLPAALVLLLPELALYSRKLFQFG